MGIDLSENGRGYYDLKEHIGHNIVCQPYGAVANPINMAIECETCNTVLVDFNKPGVNPDNDEFECKRCHKVLDIEDSIKIEDELICPDCNGTEVKQYSCPKCYHAWPDINSQGCPECGNEEIAEV